MDEPRPWHQLFALALIDFFEDTPVRVLPEQDLSQRRQMLDIVLLRPGDAPLPRPMPDGFGDLAAHNLLTFKSHQEPLDGWALNELVGHYVNYRKQAGPSMREMPPESDFRLLAVTVRTPRGLRRWPDYDRVGPGVYDVPHFTGSVRVVVIHELPWEPHNAMLHLYAADEKQVAYGAAHYKPYSAETNTLLQEMVARYRGEGLDMVETLRELAKKRMEQVVRDMSPEELLAGRTPEQLAELQRLIQARLAAPAPPAPPSGGGAAKE